MATRLALALLLFTLPAHAASYYISPTGSDSNNGTSTGTPWLSPNHPVNCGDTITAAASTAYSPANFNTGTWGAVTCAAGNNVAMLQCATFDACKISTSTTEGMWIDQSYWGVTGWEVTVTSYTYGACFIVRPNGSSPVQIHHIILINNIANGCTQSGFEGYSPGSAGFDYIAFIANLSYNTTTGSNACTSAFNVVSPTNSDTKPGTHIYLAQNIGWENINPNPCNGTTPTDGDCLIFDYFQEYSYTGQAAAENNLCFLNGGYGLSVTHNTASPIYDDHNTFYGDFNDAASGINYGGEINVYSTVNVQSFADIAQLTSSAATGPFYALAAGAANATNIFYNEWLYGFGGNNVWSTGTTIRQINNTTGTSPAFVNPSNPGAPSCGSATSTLNCMATTIANFQPTAAGTAGLGYQSPQTACVPDPLWPAWLSTVTNMPSGLVTPGCLGSMAGLGTTMGTGTKLQ